MDEGAAAGKPGRLRIHPANLSGGQQQRVAIARALAMKPKVLEQLAKEGMTLILVTHEMNFAREVGDRVVFMHQGKVWEQGESSRFFSDPKTPELRQFIASVRGLH